MTTEQWFEKAIAYFNGTMTTEEAQLFEKETAGSAELSQLLQLWKDTDAEAAIYEQHKEDAAAFIATHQKLKKDFFYEQPIPTGTKEIAAGKLKFSIWKWIAAAAAITGIIFTLKMLWPSPEKSPPFAQHKTDSNNTNKIDSAITLTAEDKKKEKDTAQTGKVPATLYAQAFAPDNIPEDAAGPLDDAFVYYAEAQYETAINAIDNAGSKASTRGGDSFTPVTNFYALYYKALSMMSLENTAGAIPLLQQAVLKSPAATLKVKAQWYLALAYLKQEKISETAETLRLVTNNSAAGKYKSKAEKLLMALKQ